MFFGEHTRPACSVRRLPPPPPASGACRAVALAKAGQNVAGCCHPVAENVATLVPDYQRCNGCCHFSNFISVLITIFDKGWVAQAPRLSRSAPRRPERGEAPSLKLPAQGRPSKASVALFTLLTRSDGNNTKTHKNTQKHTIKHLCENPEN